MKKITLSIFMLCVISTGLNAQTLREKIAAKKAALEAKMQANVASKGLTLDPNVSQSVIAAKWEDKEYTKFARHGAEDGTRKLKLTKVGGKVTEVWIGTIKYLPDEDGKSDFVRYYKTTGSGHYKIAFSEEKAIVFTTTTSGQYTLKYSLQKKASYEELKRVMAYIKDSKVNQDADLAAYAKNAKANADKEYKKREAKWSIKGKKVTKIEVTDIKAPHSFGYYRSFSYQIKATLANGKTISTKDGGFWTDYEITYANADVKNKTIQHTSFVKDDKVIINIKSKFDSKIKTTADVVMDYSETLTMSNSSNNWGVSAFSYRYEVKQRKHAVTGKDVIMIKQIDLSGYQKPIYMIIDADQSLNVYANGHNGYKTVGTGNSTGPGANAGNGGNITIIKDPSVTKFNINYTMNGGTGGAGTYGYNRGRDGRDGKYKEIVRPVNF
ncbi:MAG: hypothetical protein ACPGVD_11065 [Flavobacteriales bacterium]